MEKIVLFSRCDLVDLFGRLNKHMSGFYEIINVAYSDIEERILKNKYNIVDVINFKTETARLYELENFDENLCQTIDSLFIQYTDGRFCLNSAIQSDRTFQHLTYKECLVLAQVYYKFWDHLIGSKNVKFLLHEATALYFTHIASIVCKKYNAQYLAQIQVFGSNKYNWIFVEGDNGSPVEIIINNKTNKELSSENRLEVTGFLNRFISENEMLVPELSKVKENLSKESLSNFIVKSFRLIGRHALNSIKFNKRHSFKTTDHVELYLENLKLSLVKELRKRWNDYYTLKFDDFDSGRKYFYYPMHLEPEAVVLYWGDGIYKNQVKLIENIAGQLPPDYYLYVKDHPHGGYYREIVDYQRIMAIPNVKLLHPGVSGKAIIEKSKGVLTINGTSGFEAILLNKQVYVFGNSFFDLSNRVEKIYNVRDLRKKLYENLDKTYEDDIELFKFIQAYLTSVHNGFISYFVNRSASLHINDEVNVEIVAKEMLKYFEKVLLKSDILLK